METLDTIWEIPDIRIRALESDQSLVNGGDARVSRWEFNPPQILLQVPSNLTATGWSAPLATPIPGCPAWCGDAAEAEGPRYTYFGDRSSCE